MYTRDNNISCQSLLPELLEKIKTWPKGYEFGKKGPAVDVINTALL
jgi:hypothetical protein